MTRPYTWNPMPHVVDVTCPSCRSHASFEFAETVRIRRKEDVDYFRKSAIFEYRFVQGNYVRPGNWHAATYYHGLLRRSLTSVKDLPEGYTADDWAHSRYWYRSTGGDLGTVKCSRCSTKRKHTLDWPRDAYFQADVRGKTIWAFDRDSLTALLDFIAATDRTRARRGRWRSFLMKVPTNFLVAKNRDATVKRLSALLLR